MRAHLPVPCISFSSVIVCAFAHDNESTNKRDSSVVSRKWNSVPFGRMRYTSIKTKFFPLHFRFIRCFSRHVLEFCCFFSVVIFHSDGYAYACGLNHASNPITKNKRRTLNKNRLRLKNIFLSAVFCCFHLTRCVRHKQFLPREKLEDC